MRLSYYTPTGKRGKPTDHVIKLISWTVRDHKRTDCTFKTNLGMIVTLSREEIEELYEGINK